MASHTDNLMKAADIRLRVCEIVVSGGGGHIGGDLSCVDILIALFDVMRHDPSNPKWNERDRFILSKGHSAEAYYAVLEAEGYLGTESGLSTYGQPESRFGGHPTKSVPGIETNSGALGHGMSVGVGMAIAAKMNHQNYKTYVLCGDGELAEGSNWEAAMAASKFGLDNFCMIIDRNRLQISGSTEDTMPLEPLNKKLEAFGFDMRCVDGHDIEALKKELNRLAKGKPTAVIANTVKGKGLACAENQADWHHKTPSREQLAGMREYTQKYKEELIR
ncbi:transketolase [Christensenella hongkongensis]|uniref:Transketolase, N-terminal section n=1 Tax=Christensenella hongkongensis TaxID=270498 RepID=A0A0M2NND2_9FIRM|nr:transketolase [Christensenella hongkongensis]KKI51932.1 Transketolase, N-terminal section [Christensenella hongkongensis]TCW24530.1 transketolase subunit A [Christensenella hongkongensis]